MKIRIFKRLVGGVFESRVQTEDWSENDRRLMVKFGEPEINLGGEFSCVPNSDSSSQEDIIVRLDDVYARIMTEAPFTQKFDSRDYGSVDNAKCLMNRWCSTIEDRITAAVTSLRSKDNFFASEEITEL